MATIMTMPMPTTVRLTGGNYGLMEPYRHGPIENGHDSGLAGADDPQTTGDLPSLEADNDFDPEMYVEPTIEPLRPWHVILDFDGTITRRDTLDALVCQCILFNYEHVIAGGGKHLKLHQVRGTQQWKEWEWAKGEYHDQLTACNRGMEMCSVFNPKWVKDGGFIPGKFADPQNYPDLFTEFEVLEHRKPIEEFSVERVNKTGIFDYVGADSVLKNRAIHSDRHHTPAKIAESKEFSDFGVSIRDGFAEFTEELAKRPGSAWGVVSVNWSRDWIEGIILRELWDKNEEESTVRNIPIISNDLVPRLPPPESLATLVTAGSGLNGCLNGTGSQTENGVQNGNEQPIQPGQTLEAARPPPRGIVGMGPPLDRSNQDPTLILTGCDKLRAVKVMLKQLLRISQSSSRRGVPCSYIYIGDSTTDLACLLGADIGIIMCDETVQSPPSSDLLEPANHPLLEMLHTCGYVTRHIRDYELLYKKVGDDEQSPYVRLLWATNFDEILDSNMMSNGNWTFDIQRKTMTMAQHNVNRRNNAFGKK